MNQRVCLSRYAFPLTLPLGITLLLLLPLVPPAYPQATVNSTTVLAPTPPMGWANWNHYFCDYNDQTIRDQADALVSTGMRDLGYKYLIIQECIAPARNADGSLIVDSKRFPHGIRDLADYIHSRGLKAGIYTDVGPFTCFSDIHYQGSYDHEQQDAATFASWGIDLIEEDFCNKPKDHTGRELYQRMAAAIRSTGRPMLLYICSWGEESPWEWARGVGQFWRTTGDISMQKNHATWDEIVRNFESNAQHSSFNGPDSWNDPDMLEVGNPGITPTEARSHFSMWAISGAPLLAGADLTHMDAETLAIFTNTDVLAVDQDPLGSGPLKVPSANQNIEIWQKPLGSKSSSTRAVLLLNRGSQPTTASVRWQDVGIPPNSTVRDLWSHQDLGPFPSGYSTQLPPHASVLLKISSAPSPTHP